MNLQLGTGIVSSIKRILTNGTTPPRPEPSPRTALTTPPLLEPSPRTSTTPIAEEIFLPSGLSEEQATALLLSLPLPEREISWFVLDTGLGTTETFSLKWTAIAIVNGAWWIRVVHRTVPMTVAARAIVRRQFEQRKTEPLVFDPKLKRSINKTLDEAGLKIGVAGVRMKTLRATFALRLYRQGVSLSRVRGLEGCVTATMRVVPATPAGLRAAIETLSPYPIA